MTQSPLLSRRRLLVHAVAGGVSLPYLVPRTVLAAPGKPGANERVTIGVIGTGGRARLLIDQLPESGQIASVCDCYLRRAEEAAKQKQARWRIHQDHRRLLDEKDIDAVLVVTTDHGRVLPSIHACQAGKDVYAEKPLTLTIREGRVLVQAVRKYGRVFQVGSQQRSMEMNRFACEFVRSGGIGKIKLVQGINYTGPNRYQGLPEQPIPEGLDWDRWLGQAEMRPYNAALHFGWMGWRDFSGGEMTNWGAHGLDQIQWALGMDDSGPVEIWPVTPGPNGKVSYRYANGIEVRLELEKGPHGGAIFTGDHGKIEINRNKFTTNPKDLVKNPPPEHLADKWRDEVALWQARYHMENWIDCIKTRQRPVADVEIGHRSITVCHLANIARELGRRLQWDPQKEQFVGDDEADRYLSRPRRKGYELPEVV
ncbi:MAG: Gfo/Idh/MocA family oxidoreductase [Thermoguttaceae bacterium]|jgi:predicted dehydrogenase|nr:Gfo/Idh/MocA family oxidoreductase [Thermoguttaceae bacterium]